MTSEQEAEIIDRSQRWCRKAVGRYAVFHRLEETWICILMDDKRRFGIEAEQPDRALDLALQRWASEEN